jgi:hypothetical protein
LGRSSVETGKDAGALLAAETNGSREMYVTGTKWMGRGAVRLAVSNWRTGLQEGEQGGGKGESDLEVVQRVLRAIAE